MEVINKFNFSEASVQLEKGDFLFGNREEKEKELNEYLKNLDAHKARIESYTHEYNFIGISQAFAKIQKKKNRSLWIGRFILCICGASLVAVPYYLLMLMVDPQGFFGVLGFSLDPEKINSIVERHSWKLSVPFVTVEFMLLYFFRINLMDLKGYSAQILQLNLRQSLCEFIQEYAKYSKEINSEMPNLLDKFENVIFSPIVAHENDIPSTLDGVNQLADLIGKAKKASQ